MKRKKKNPLPHPAADLFGEIPVTWPEVYKWVEVVAPRFYGTARMAWYIERWDVAGKVRRAKEAGIYEVIISETPP